MAAAAASFAELCAADPRVVLVPAEELSPAGLAPAFAAWLQQHAGWSRARIALFDAAFAAWWQRATDLARRCRDWPPPRRRNVAIAHHPDAVPPWAQILNTGTWTLYACDFDPDASHPELAAWLFAHGDRMALTGEVTEAALRNAAWWFERSDTEIAAFGAAAARSPRPDGDALRLVAAAVPWLRRLAHARLRPPGLAGTHRPIAGSELLVGRDLEHEPPALVQAWTTIARGVVARQQARWQQPRAGALAALCDWLRDDAPPLRLVARRRRVVWDPAHPDRVGAVRAELRACGGEVVASLHADLEVVAARTRAFRAALVAPAQLAPVPPTMEEAGYVFFAADGTLALDVHEPGVARLAMPALPFARAMLAARTVHEWGHRADDSGWIPAAVAAQEWRRRRAACAEAFAAVFAAAPAAIRRRAAADIAAGGAADGTADAAVGAALAAIVAERMPDWRANLLAQRFLAPVEREAYVRQNIRTLDGVMPPHAIARRLARYLYEAQYLRFSRVGDRLAWLRLGTGFEQEFLASGLLTESTLADLDARVGALCDAWAVDESRFLPPV